MKVMIIPIVMGALGTVTKRLLQGPEDLEIRGCVETIQITSLLRSARILRRALEIKEICCHSMLMGEKTQKGVGAAAVVVMMMMMIIIETSYKAM